MQELLFKYYLYLQSWSIPLLPLMPDNNTGTIYATSKE